MLQMCTMGFSAAMELEPPAGEDVCTEPKTPATNRGQAAWIRVDSKICILLSASWGEEIKPRRLGLL